MGKIGWGLLVLTSIGAMASIPPQKVICEVSDNPDATLEYDHAAKKIDLIWIMESHDGSKKTWREPLVGPGFASGYQYPFSSCQTTQLFEAASVEPPGRFQFEYTCGSFTRGRLEIGETNQFYAKTWINGGYTDRKIPVHGCR